MNPEQQRIKIAEACGHNLFVLHKPIHDPFGYYRENAHGYTNDITKAWQVTMEVARKYVSGRASDLDRVVLEPAPIPDYLNDLNAMHEAEQILRKSARLRGDYSQTLGEICANDHSEGREYGRELWHATAAQRAEAFLRTLGLWEEAQ